MRGELSELVRVLEGLIDAGKALLGASKRKCRALGAMKLEQIQQTTDQEAQLAERIAGLNARYREIVASMEGEVTSPSGTDAGHDASLARLIERLEEPDRTRLSVLRQQVGAVMKDVKFANVTNGIVSRRSLKHFREMLGLLSGAGLADEGYTRAGTVQRRFGPSRLVNQIA